MKRLAPLVAITVALILPGVAAAQDEDAEGVAIRINGTLAVGADQRLDTAIAINSDVIVDGVIRDALFVVNGDARINGAVEGDVEVVNGSLDLGSTASVNNVVLTNSELSQADGATISGSLSERTGYHFGWGRAIFSFVFWVGTTIALLLAGLIFAAVGPRTLIDAAATLTGRIGPSVLTAVILWIGLPIVAVVTLLTVVGIPVGLAIFLIAMPALWVLGYLIASTRLGAELVRRTGVRPSSDRPFLPVIVGVLIFQIIGLVPVVGGLLLFLAGLVGAGALGYLVWTNRQRRAAPALPGFSAPGALPAP